MSAAARPTPLFPSPPRAVRRAGGSMRNIGCLRVFLLPFVVIGLGSLTAVPLRLYVQTAGTPITATVDGLTAHAGRKGGRTYTAAFHYDLAGRRYDDTQQVEAAEYARLRRGQVVHGRMAILFGHSLALTDAGSVWRQTAFAAGFALFWNAVVGVLVYVAYVQPWRTRRLVRDGTAVPGTVTGRRVISGKSKQYRVTYAFQTRDRRPFTREMAVDRRDYDGVADGQAVTVIYDENRPGRSVAYELSGLTVEK